MASTYTPKLNLAKPAHGDVDWHIPINENWDKLDSKLGPLYENITDNTTKLTVKKDIDIVGVLTAEKIKTTSYLWTPDPGLTKPRYIDNKYVENYTTSWVTAKITPAAKIGVLGTATIHYDISTPSISGSTIKGDVRLLKNDVVVPNSEYTVTNSSKFITIDVPVTTGDIFKLQIKNYSELYGCYTNVFGIYAFMTPIVDENETWS
jgi:hypothetical protein